MSEAPAVVEVEVNEATDDAPPADTGDTVVVVTDDGGDDGASDGEIGLAQTVGALTAQVEQLTQRLNETVWAVESAEATAEVALEVADAAGQTAADVAEETATDAELAEIEEDVPPIGKPWFAKSFHELRHGGQ